MASTKQAIFDALSKLLQSYFEEFKWQLSNAETQDESIPCGKLENANCHNVVDLMVQQYDISKAGMIAVKVLRKIKRNDLANELQGKLQEVSEDVSAAGGASSGAAASTVSTAGVRVTINTASGGTVKAPVLHGGVFNGPVNFS
ncbi:hypothetical protein Q8A67_005305 [Cirrhinus molitorella]|uniref:Pyrin domain-containing protein n=1 Tax=Cirrhinus molitorella TaxID=172907 RepID=A0AA88TXB0_9TELE|nr:hypothetical protein Q8A67_005305 [Cirrhinus molitorella]